MFGDTLDVPLTGSKLPKKQGPDTHLHSLYIVEVVLKLEQVVFLESTHTTEDPHTSLQQQDLSGRLLPRDQQQIPTLLNAQLHQALLVVQKDN